MDITLPLIENVALLALAALIYMATPQKEDGWSAPAQSLSIGFGLGFTSAMVMLIPVTLMPGLIVDARSAPILLSGILGGPLTALVAVVPPIAMRIWIGGIGMEAGVAGLIMAATCSVIAFHVLRRGLVPRSLPMLLVYAAVSTVISLPSIFLLPDFDMALALLPKISLMLLLTNIGGTAILALLISLETRRRTLVVSLRESEAAAQEALNIRNRFIAMMSHEVRTPLNAVLGYAQLLRDDTLSARQSDRVNRLSDSAKALLLLIDDILQFSRLQSEALSVERQRHSLPALIDDAMAQIRGDANRKGLEIRHDVAAVPALMIEIDGPRLRQILVNILSNAVKFTERGHVTIAVALQSDTPDPDAPETAKNGSTLHIAVSDSGIGIPQDRLEKIYEPFERLGTAAVPGTGLGMAIVRAVVDAMGGTISVTSSRDSGTTVTVALPTEVDGPVPQARAAAPATDAVYRPARDPVRVLVVDDIELNADIACAFLQQVGCETATAVNGSDAVDAVRDGGFDAVLMDIEMPVMDGLAATRAIRGALMPEKARATPIIALTAYASRADMQACLEAGMNGYLSKPVEKEALFAALARHGVLRTDAPVRRRDDTPPVFSEDRFTTLANLVPPPVLQNVLAEASNQIESLGAQVAASSVGLDDKRQALHKLISIAGNIGLLQLSALSRHYQETIKAGGTLDEDDIAAFSRAVDKALAQVGELRDPSPKLA